MGKEIKETNFNESPITMSNTENGIFYGNTGNTHVRNPADNENNDSKLSVSFNDSNDNPGVQDMNFLIGVKPCNEDEVKFEAKNGIGNVREDFLQNLLFPHMETKVLQKIMGKRSSKSKLELLQRNHFVVDLLCPSHSESNMKVFGGKKAVEAERERSKHSGYIIHPCSKFRQYWDLLIMIMLVMNMFILPLDIAFFADKTWVVFHVASDLLCMTDIVFNFRTAYLSDPQRKTFELDQGKIAKQYLKTWFILDLISSLPLHYVILLAYGEPENVYLGLKGASRALKFVKIVKLLNLLKLLRLTRLIRGISQYEDVYCITTGLMRYIKLLCMMMMVAHWNGCLHFLVPLLQDFPDDCWVKLAKLQDKQWYMQYGWAVFKTLSHMLSIGYGQYTPRIFTEAILTIFTMVTGTTFYALFIAHSMAYVIQHDLSKTSYQEKVKQIDEYMLYRNLPNRIKKKVKLYFTQKFCQGRFFNEDDVLSGLSKPLRNDIVRYTFQDIVETIPFLRNASSEFVSAILAKISSEVYLVGDVILKEGTCISDIFFVKKGNLELTVNDKVVESLTDGAYFGEISVLTGKRSIYSVTAISNCDVFILPARDARIILEEYDEMRPLIEHVAMERIVHIYKQCEVISLDQRSCQTSYNSPEEEKLNDPLYLVHEVIKENLEQLFTTLLNIKSKNEKAEREEEVGTTEMRKLIARLLNEHEGTHGACDLSSPRAEARNRFAGNEVTNHFSGN